MRALLRLLGKSESSGVLRVRTESARARVILVEGRILQASLDSVPPLGESLVRRGVLEDEQLDAALSIQKRSRSSKPLGQILVELGLVERGDVGIAVDEQVRSVLEEMLAWRAGSYAFEPTPESWSDPAFAGIAIVDLIGPAEEARQDASPGGSVPASR